MDFNTQVRELPFFFFQKKETDHKYRESFTVGEFTASLSRDEWLKKHSAECLHWVWRHVAANEAIANGTN